MERHAELDMDAGGRLLVFPVAGHVHAAPARLLPAETTDRALGEAILTVSVRQPRDGCSRSASSLQTLRRM